MIRMYCDICKKFISDDFSCVSATSPHVILEILRTPGIDYPKHYDLCNQCSIKIADYVDNLKKENVIE